ncbi:inositol monophosphatase family protein [Rhodanobacter aciditrophus]|uniref:Inositol-1-monophosphatase n=1 Tax=Rhodanobacter aciditrophus TaxID=1623218 RepID=A0ABW4AXU4_9GAMM
MSIKFEPDRWLESAKEWALHAGGMMQQGRANAEFKRDYKAGHELVTSVDLAVDDYLCTQIVSTFPGHLILSEESSPDLNVAMASDVPVWVIDPIDGTVNFAQGLPHVAVSIAVFYRGERWVGVVYGPFLNEMYSAVKGKGAWLNDRPISVSGRNVLRNAVVATGFPYQRDTLYELMGYVTAVLANCQDIRRNGSAALDLCAVANGQMDAYYENVKPWDMAAGALIAEEAGATIGAFGAQRAEWPKAINGDSLIVATPELYDAINTLLQESRIELSV